MTGRHTMWDGSRAVEITTPVSGPDNVMTPVIRAVVTDRSGEHILLQRRDVPGEPVRGLLEIPGGRWIAAEPPEVAIAREVRDETGIKLLHVEGVTEDRIDDRRSVATIRPLAVIAGIHGAYPATHTVLVAVGEGTPRPEPGGTTDVRWWSLQDVRHTLATDRDAFVPAAWAALTAYVTMLDSTT